VTKCVLVTGATGFVGNALARRLAQGPFHVRGSVRQAARSLPANVEQVRGDLTSETDWSAALHDVHAVVHCAARVHVMHDTSADPLSEFRHANVAGTLHLARQAASAGVRRFVFLSSVKVLGESSAPGRPLHPDAVPAPQDAYAVSKLEAEGGLRSLAAATGMEVVIIRPPLVYGPGVKGNFAALVRWIQRGRPLPFGAVENRRSLVALDNLVSFAELCADVERSPAAANQAFLVADGADESTAELVRKIARAYGTQARLVSVPPALMRWGARILGKQAAADRLLGSLQVDSSKCTDLLGWKPVVTMDEQLKSMAAVDAGT